MAQKKTLHSYMHSVFIKERKLRGNDLARIGISPGQPKMLHYIAAHNGGMQKDIAQATGIEPPSATSILSIMERDGLISREKAADDRRRMNIFITEKGKEKLTQIQALDSRHEELLLTGFSEEEKAQLIDFLLRMDDNAKKYTCQGKQTESAL
ncbi:MarR family transcriptional regulator [Ruminococcaceae bacterium OttesenSCG-928-N02]|nr:MarR family transcriptional regulator [Ruminococcaceae bacterium OttesenSCG-928-N02]